MYSVTRTDVKKIAAQIECLAKQVQDYLDKNSDLFLQVANELVRDSSTMIFVLGELHASEQLGVNNSGTKKTASKSTTRSPRRYFRDSRGRFTSNPKKP